MIYQPGQQLGQYRLLRFLGRGGFAEVYLGEHIHLHTQAALKVLRMSLTEEVRRQFLTEARIIASLDHPHIVQIRDYGVEEGMPFLVMRYAPHGCIRAVHPPGTRVPLTTVVAYVNQIASALQYAHDHKLVHRDVKPENMLLGDRHHLLLSDFGLATIVHSSQQQNPQNVAGTVSYMAPEQIHGSPCSASDQYALAIVVYEWLAGALPFTGSRLQVAIQHLMAPAPSLCTTRPDLTPAVEQVLHTALARKPQERFACIAEFARTLEQVLQSKETPVLKQEISSGLPSSSEQQQIVRPRQQRLIGREQELVILHQALLETEGYFHSTPGSSLLAAEGLGKLPSRLPCLVLFGEAGIGKTRLAEEASQAAQTRGWAVIWGRGYAQEGAIPYRLWTDIVRAVRQQELSADLEHKPLHIPYQPLTMLLPELQDSLPAQSMPLSPSPQQEPLRLWEALLAVLLSASKRAPLLLVLDDLQWMDASSCKILSYLCRHFIAHPVLIIGTCRETDLPLQHTLHTQLEQLERERLFKPLVLSALTNEQIASLLEHLPASTISAIQRQASGNPLFARELAYQCDQHGTEKKPKTSIYARTQSTSLPSAIALLLAQRLRSLSPTCHQFLRSAAVLRRSFSLTTICKLFTDRTASLNKGQVLTLIEEALQCGVLTEHEQGVDITYHFWHPLFTQYLYETLSLTRRTQIHHTIAAILQQIYAPQEIEGAAVILQHLLKGHGHIQQIAHYAQLAARHAYALAAYPEAEQHYRTALEHFNQHDSDWQRLAYLLEMLGECTRIQGNYEDSYRFYEQALEVRHRQPIPILSNEHRKECQIRALLWCEIGSTWWYRANIRLAQECYQRSEQVLSDADIVDGPAKAYLLYLRGSSKLRSGKYEDAYLDAKIALNLFERFGNKKENRIDFHHATLINRILAGDPINLGRTHILLGNIATECRSQCNEALTHFNMALTIYEQNGFQREISRACCALGDTHMRKAGYGQAQSFFRRSLSIAEQIGDNLLACVAFGNLGLLALRLGNLSNSEQRFLEGIKLAKRINDPVYISLFSSVLAGVLHSRGKIAEAKENFYLALRVARSARIASCIGQSLVGLGNVRLIQACLSDQDKEQFDKEKNLQLLRRAKKTLEHALSIEGVEMQIQIEGRVALGQVVFLLGEPKQAYQQIIRAQDDAHRFELAWLTPRIQQLLGNILSTQVFNRKAYEHYEQALQVAQKYNMHLEYARVMQDYGKALLTEGTQQGPSNQQGLQCLHEARQIFIKCDAILEMQSVEHLIASHEELCTHEILT